MRVVVQLVHVKALDEAVGHAMLRLGRPRTSPDLLPQPLLGTSLHL